MQREEIRAVLEEISRERLDLFMRKSANYAKEENGFANFDLVPLLTGGKITREQGIFVRMCDKISRLGNLMFGVEDQVGESREDSLFDIGTYADICLASYRSREEQAEEEIEPPPGGPSPAAIEFLKKLMGANKNLA